MREAAVRETAMRQADGRRPRRDGQDGQDGQALERQRVLLSALEAQWRRLGCRVQRFETHISWVFVVDALAYKFKKALRFDVLDYSTLEARQHCCAEEVRLNRRLAPSIYIGVAAVTGSAARPELDGAGPVLDYAVRMRAFPQQSLWSERLGAGLLDAAQIDSLALRLAQFHARAEAPEPDSGWGTARALARRGAEDLAAVADMLRGRRAQAQLARLARWHRQQTASPGRFAQRRAEQRIRACHGDLHSANIVTLDGQVEAFDCIEFNEELRWIDVMSDVAFIAMDLRFHGRPDLAARLLQGYLEQSGDYAGLAVLNYYETMRAVVRCKVCLLRAALPEAAPQARMLARRYLELAGAGLRRRGAVVLMHGCSGSGKSYCAERLAGALGAICIRSDVERKRLHGVAAAARMEAASAQGIYGRASSEATYARLRGLARAIAGAGMSVIVDAAHLQRAQRQAMRALANACGAPFFIVDLQADAALLRARLERRTAEGGDASDAGVQVLAYQFATREALSAAELRHVLPMDSRSEGLAERLAAAAAHIRAALR